MEQEMVLISREQCERMISLLTRAEGYCRNARPTKKREALEEPTASYAGASGYAGATMRDVIQSLESHLG